LLVFHACINEMHGPRSKIPSKDLFRQRCAEGFNSGVKGLKLNFMYSTLCMYTYVQKLISHLREIMPVIKTCLLFSFRKIIAVCCEDHMGHIIALCGQNSEVINVTAVVACICHWVLNGFNMCLNTCLW
jgi:hypothetical protein